MNKYKFSNEENNNFYEEGVKLFKIMDNKKKEFEYSCNKKFNKDLSKVVFRKQVIRDIESENNFIKIYGNFGKRVLKIVPNSYIHDILAISIITILCLIINAGLCNSLYLISLYISLSFINSVIKKQQLDFLIKTGIIRVQEIYGIFEYHYYDLVDKKWSNNRVSDEEVEIIKNLLCPESFIYLNEGDKAIKYGEERYLKFIYDLKTEINKINKGV